VNAPARAEALRVGEDGEIEVDRRYCGAIVEVLSMPAMKTIGKMKEMLKLRVMMQVGDAGSRRWRW